MGRFAPFEPDLAGGSKPESEGLSTSSDYTRPSFRNELDLSPTSVGSKDELVGRLQEIGRTSYDILSICETRREVELDATWRDENTGSLEHRTGIEESGRNRVCCQQKVVSANHLSISLEVNWCVFFGLFQHYPRDRPSLCSHHGKR